MTRRDLPAIWRARATELERFAPPAAEAFRVAADELDAALRAQADETLTLVQASAESGYSTRRLRELVADGTVPNAGRKGAPRFRRADLPRKPRTSNGAYSAVDDAQDILGRLRRKEAAR